MFTHSKSYCCFHKCALEIARLMQSHANISPGFQLNLTRDKNFDINILLEVIDRHRWILVFVL